MDQEPCWDHNFTIFQPNFLTMYQMIQELKPEMNSSLLKVGTEAADF